LIGRDNWLFYAEENIRDAGKPGIDASVALIRHAQEKLAARSIGLVVVVAPAKARFYPDRLPAGHAVSADALPRYGYIISALAAAGIPSVNLIPVLKGVETGEQTAFLQKDSHWTAWSAEAAARAVADLIRAKWTLRGAAGGGTPLGDWVKERRAGDFLQLMTADQRKQVGQQIYVVRANKAGKAGLLADADTPVHIVGNSFVQPYLGFPQALSAALDRPVGLSWKYGNFGPWASFREYLESAEFRRERPQVVVWQFNEAQLLYGPNASGQWDANSLMTEAAWRAGVASAAAK
jgi:alginate O-acetyltransferase complex protein AlgJ